MYRYLSNQALEATRSLHADQEAPKADPEEGSGFAPSQEPSYVRTIKATPGEFRSLKGFTNCSSRTNSPLPVSNGSAPPQDEVAPHLRLFVGWPDMVKSS